MKKNFVLILFVCFFPLTAFGKNINLENCFLKKFIVSWYYSPQENQKFYYRGNFSSETRLNWNWYRWASGKKVFNGMIAAPKKYSFWTKIYFPWYWIGKVEDRGGAILEAGKRWYKYDRIDIWMWAWEKWLKRSLSFGKRVLKWYVCYNNKAKVGFDMEAFPVFKHFFGTTLWWINLSIGRKDNWVLALQKYLAELGYMKSKNTTSYFGPITKNALCNYQSDYGIVSKNNRLCGYFWPQTRSSLKNVLQRKKILPTNIYSIYEDKKSKNSINQKKQDNKENNNKITFDRWFIVGENWEKIKYLQKYLEELWYYSWKISWVYTKDTAEAVYQFQLEHNIIDSDSDKKALGYFWPKTREKFAKILLTHQNW